MVLGNDGADKVSVVMTDASGNTETKGYALEGEGGQVSFYSSFFRRVYIYNYSF